MDQLIGRDAEVARLLDRLREAASGRGRVVLLGGEPGIGKTRLVEEVGRRARGLGLPVAWGRGVEVEGAPPFWLWRQVLRDLAAQGDAAELQRCVGDEGPALAVLAPELGRMLGVEAAAVPDSAEARFRVFDAVGGFLRRSAAAAGMLVVLDDLHRADRSSLLLLRHVAGELPRTRVLVVATHREGEGEGASELDALARLHADEPLRLGALDPDACALQLQAIAGDTVDAGVAARVHAITGGNPFFTAQMARLLLSAGGGEVGAGSALEVPSTVRGVVQARVAQLSDTCRALLDDAAVVGRDVDVEVLAVMEEQPVTALLDALQPALRARLLEPGVVPGQLRFAHLLLRETLYAELAPSRRAALHRRAAEALEWLHAERLEPHLAAIAQHRFAAATSGEDAVVASQWLRRAADAAMARLAWEEGVRLLRLALDAGGERIDVAVRAETVLALAAGLARSGELAESLRHCVEASHLARLAGRAELMAAAALVLEGVSDPHWNAMLVRLCDDALAELSDEAAALRARLLASRTAWRLLDGDRDGAEETSRQAVALAEQSGDDMALATALRARQVVRSGPEGIEERLGIADRMLEIGARHRDAAALLWGRLWRIDVLIERGELAAARREVDILAQQVDTRSGPVARWHLQRLRSLLAQARGDFDAAVELATAARDIMVRADHPQAAGLYDAFRSGAMAHHRGGAAQRVTGVRGHLAMVPGPFGNLVRVSLVNLLLWAGLGDQARVEYRLLPPVGAEGVPDGARVAFDCFRAAAAAQVGECDDARRLYASLLPYRDHHIGAGAPEYRGAVELALGVVMRHCGDAATAVAHLQRAVEVHTRCEAVPFVVESQCELVEVLLAGHADERRRARDLARDALGMARHLGMQPFVERLQRVLDEASRGLSSSPLSRREEEVAALVAQGLTSREIATRLHLSERTAQNHVQHILDKLGFASRSQIAAWVASRATSEETLGRGR